VNAATAAGHTCGWSVGQGNSAAAMTMIRLRCGGWHHPTGTTGGSWRPLSVDQVLSRTCQAPGHIARCWLSQTARCRPRARMVQWCHVWRWQPRQCTSECNGLYRQCSGGVLPQKMLFLEFTWLTTENVRSLNCNWAAWIDVCRKYASTINIFCSVVHGIPKVKFGRLLEQARCTRLRPARFLAHAWVWFCDVASFSDASGMVCVLVEPVSILTHQTHCSGFRKERYL